MNILVVSYSTIVLELLKMVFKSESIKSEHVKSLKDSKDESYNIIFIDDSTPNLTQEIEEIIDNYSYNKLILIGSNKEAEELVDIVINKPFLPKDIKDIIESIDIEELETPKTKETKVLDPTEIERIKALMSLEEELEESLSLESTFFELLEDKESLNLKKKGAKEFLYECTNLTPKELKKLLKGAKVSIKIKFKSDSNE